MKNLAKFMKYGTNILCWLVKGIGAALLLLLLAIVVGEGPPNPFKLSAKELFIMAVLIITIIGFGLAIWRQLIGGIFILAGIATFTITGGLEHNWVFYAFWLLGILNIICWILKKSQMNKIS